MHFVTMLLRCEIWIFAVAGSVRSFSGIVSKVPGHPATLPTNNPRNNIVKQRSNLATALVNTSLNYVALPAG
jgi:hypothetical protein